MNSQNVESSLTRNTCRILPQTGASACETMALMPTLQTIGADSKTAHCTFYLKILKPTVHSYTKKYLSTAVKSHDLTHHEKTKVIKCYCIEFILLHYLHLLTFIISLSICYG